MLSRGGREAERWGFYVLSGPPLWLVVEVDAAPEGTHLCVVWPDPNGEPAAESCQLLPAGPARLAFHGPENRQWPPGRYVAQLVLAKPSHEPLAEVAYAIGEELPQGEGPPLDGPPKDQPPGDDIVSFPWPPPAPTTQTVLNRTLLVRDAATLGDVAERLTTALEGLGYSEHSFYRAPGGFVLATRLEQIEFDGTPKAEPLRWSAVLPPREDLLARQLYRRAVFGARRSLSRDCVRRERSAVRHSGAGCEPGRGPRVAAGRSKPFAGLDRHSSA